MVMTGESWIKAGHLVLVPLVGLSSIGTKKSAAGAATFTLKSGVSYYASAPPRPNATGELDKQVLSAYFWVQTTHKADEANMREAHITTNGIQISVLKNSVGLKPHTKLVQYEPAIGPPERCTSFVAHAAPEPKRAKKAT